MKKTNVLLAIYIPIGIIGLWYTFLLVFYFGGLTNVNAEDSTLDKLGLIGDSFGMLNTLFSGLALAALLYTLKQQQDIIEIGAQESSFKIIFEELKELKIKFSEFTFPVIENEKGVEAIKIILANNEWRYTTEVGDNSFYQDIKEHSDLFEFKLLLEDVNRIFYMLDNMKPNNKQSIFLLNDLKHLNRIFLSSCIGIMQREHFISNTNKNSQLGSSIDILRKDIYLNIEGISEQLESRLTRVTLI